MGKKILLIVPIIALIVFAYFYMSINPPVAVAELVITSGSAQVMHPGGDWIDATNGIQLAQGDSVRTLEASAASIIFFESSILRMDESTAITLTQIDPTGGDTQITIEQEAGRTWNKILRLSGITEYNIESPTTVATVRGTGFGFYVGADGSSKVLLDEGTLDLITYVVENGVKKALQNAQLNAGEMVNIDEDGIRDAIQKLAIQRDEFINSNINLDQEHLRRIKEQLLQRFSTVMPTIKQQYGVTDEQISQGIDMYLRGEDMSFMPPAVTDFLERRIGMTEMMSKLASGEFNDSKVVQEARERLEQQYNQTEPNTSLTSNTSESTS